ncbi:MAG: hypothetical protein QUS14_08195, partial [Pyrinomonadaceae bacterium]|nr:hypothetical protein [Pyrinomonadaceae bacterium]
MKQILNSIAVIAFAGLIAPAAAYSQTKAVAPLDVFWQELNKLCGKAFAGVIAADTSNSPDFAGKALVCLLYTSDAADEFR